MYDSLDCSYSRSNGTSYLLQLAEQSTTYKSKTCESLDYDLFESQARLRYQKRRATQTSWTETKRWLLTALVAAFTAAFAVLITYCTRNLLRVKYNAVQHFLSPPSPSTNTTGSYVLAWVLLATINAAFVGLASFVVVYMAPIAGGSGIPEI